jgi:tetratricopeptide (TPR) repeat protein
MLMWAQGARGGGGPEGVVLVVNGDSWVSKAVANEYISLRDIPEVNVIVLNNIPNHETIGVNQFRSLILQPVLASMQARQIISQVDYITYSTDFPYAIDLGDDIGGRKLHKIVGRNGSLTGLTYLYQGVLAQNLDYVDLNTNWYARQMLRRSGDSSWSAEEQEDYGRVEDFFAERAKREKKVKNGDLTKEEFDNWEQDQWQEALNVMNSLRAAHPNAGHLLYNIACSFAQLNRPDEAIAALRQAVEAGYLDHRHAARDPDLTSLRERQDFQDLLNTMKTTEIPMAPPMPFSAGVGWTPQGTPCPPYKGARYLLSTMLAYTSGRGNSLAEVKNYLQRAAEADGDKPAGTIYFMRNNDVRSTTREWALASAAALTEEAGVHTEILEGVLPRNRDDVMGVFTGTASFNWNSSGSTIQPGAICEHLTSYGGILREGAGQTPLTEFLRHGAAGSSGTIQEPFAIQAKFPIAFMQAYYAMGASLAEAYYLSVRGPYQLLIVGDPLCRPWATFPEFDIQGLNDGEVLRDAVEVSGKAAPDSTPIAHFEVYLDGRRVAMLRGNTPFSIPVDRMADGVHELRMVAVRRGHMQTRGYRALTFLKRRAADSLRVATVERDTIPFDQEVEFNLALPAKSSLELFYLGINVAQAEAGDETIRVPASLFGLGPVMISPVLKNAAGHPVLAEKIRFTVIPPEPTALVPAGLEDVLPPGMLLTTDAGLKTVVDRTDGDWLAKAGVEPGNRFALTAWFDLDSDQLSQFQFDGNVVLEDSMTVDDRTCTIPENPGWRSLPVNLKKGGHRFVIRGIAVKKPRLDVRFGAQGTKVLDKKTFRYREH